MRVEILHNTTSRFQGYSESDALVSKYTYERANLTGKTPKQAETLLGLIFRENNMVDGNELPHVFQVRSLSVGDVVVLSYDPETVAEAWCVEQSGWEPVELGAVTSSVAFGKRLIAQSVSLSLWQLGHTNE